MNNPYEVTSLLKHYAWHARDCQNDPRLASQLLQAALNIVLEDLPGEQSLLKQLRRDIAELNGQLGDVHKATHELIDIGDGFTAGDMLMAQGRYNEAFATYYNFHKNGRFRIWWRLWKVCFLLSQYRDVLIYTNQHGLADPARHVTYLEVRVMAVAASYVFKDFNDPTQWDDFQESYFSCAGVLRSKVGDPPAIVALANRWRSPTGIERLRRRILGKAKPKPESVERTPDQEIETFERIYKKALDGVWDIVRRQIPPNATSVLKSCAESRRKLDGQTVLDHMAKGLVSPILMNPHRAALSKFIDSKLLEFEEKAGRDFVAFYRDIILGGFGYFDSNPVSEALRCIILDAESDLRASNHLPPRGQGWLGEAEMIRLLKHKFAPHEVLRQHSPDWLRGQRFDAFLPDLQMAVEFQGQQHFEPVEIFGGEQGFSETLARDELKRQLATSNGVTIEYISYDQDLEAETSRLASIYLP